MTGKAEIRGKVKVLLMLYRLYRLLRVDLNIIMKEFFLPIWMVLWKNIRFIEAENDEYCRQMLQAQLNKTTKFCRKPVIGSNNGKSLINIIGWTNSTGFSASTKEPITIGPNGSRFTGHNYTVSINFNRPQQSKGTRPIRGTEIKIIK